MYVCFLCLPLNQVLAYDADIGENGRITYSMKAGKGKHKFRMDADTGTLYAAPGTVLEAGKQGEATAEVAVRRTLPEL